jgi:hypothetical protein
MRRAARVDGNQAEIVEALRRIGGYWIPTWRHGDGTPDGIIWFRGRWFPAEIKQQGERLTDHEREMHEACPGRILILRSVDEMLRALGAVE